MSSSINPPIANSKRFQFDLDFEVEEERLRLEMIRQAELLRQADLNTPAPAIYTEDNLQAAKDEAFQSGVQQGMEDAKKSLEAVIVSLVERALQNLQMLLQEELQRDQLAQETALRTTLAIIKKFWPHVLQTTSVELLEKTLRDAVATNPDESRIVLRVHDSLLDNIIKRLPQIKEQEAFSGKIIVVADDTILPGDCKLEWADGGLERLGSGLTQRLDEAMQRILATLKHTTNTKNAEQERISS